MLDRLLGRRRSSPYDEAIRAAAREAQEFEGNWIAPGAARASKSGAALLESTREELTEVVVACLSLAAAEPAPVSTAAHELASAAMRRELPFTEAQLSRALDDLVRGARVVYPGLTCV